MNNLVREVALAISPNINDNFPEEWYDESTRAIRAIVSWLSVNLVDIEQEVLDDILKQLADALNPVDINGIKKSDWPDLIDKITAAIPPQAWPIVLTSFVENFVDNMPSEVLVKLTGEATGFEIAERILLSYYEESCDLPMLIKDGFLILGPENTIWLLESLALDKFIVLKGEPGGVDETNL